MSVLADISAEPIDYAESMPAKPFRFGVMRAKKNIEEAQSGQYFFTSGISTVDALVRFRPATYTVIAAQSGTGKTALALQIAAHIENTKHKWGDKRKTLIFSAEMSSDELAHRIAGSRTGISVWDQLGGTLMPEQVALLYDTLDEIANDTPFYIDEEPSPSHEHIFNSCNIIKESFGLSSVILDYIELAASDEKFKGEHVRSIAKMLKTVSKEFRVPTIGISQVNKDNTHRAEKKPQMTDLRYGGHEPADTVVILQRREDMANVPEDCDAVQGHVVKNRGGRLGVADMFFKGPKTEFYAGNFQQVDLNEEY